MSEQATEEQLAQCFLAANCLHIIRGASRDQQDGPALRVGPPLLAVKRVKGTERSLKGTPPKVTADPPAFTVNSTIVSDYSSITDLADMFSIEEEQGALTMITNLKGLLQPDFAFYKMYRYDDADGSPAWKHVRMRPEEFPYQQQQKDPDHKRDSRINFTKIEWQQLGGNPAEIDSNIAFKVTLNTRDLSNFFTPWVPGQREGQRKFVSDAAYGHGVSPEEIIPPIVQAVFEPETGTGVRWIDLIQVSTGAGDRCVDKYEPSRIQLMVGYKWDKSAKEAARKVIEAYCNPPGGQPPLVSDDGTLTGQPLVDWHLNDFEKMVKSQTKYYDLNLMRHEIKYTGAGEDVGTVELEISYIASIEYSQRNTQSDLFHDYGLRKYADIKKAELAKLNWQLGMIQPIQGALSTTPSPGAPHGSNLTAAQLAKNERRESCRAELEIKTQELQQQIANANVRAKKRLLNQLLLGTTYGQQANLTRSQTQAGRNVSRVYWTIITQEALMSTLPFAQPSLEDNVIPVYNYASLAASGFLEMTVGPGNQRGRGKDYERSDEREERELLELYGQDISELSEIPSGFSSASGVSTGEKGLPTYLAEDPKKLVKFIFLGDIIEAALEIVAENLYISQHQAVQARIENRAKTAAGAGDPPTSGKYNWENIDYTNCPTFFAGIGDDHGPERQNSAIPRKPPPPTPSATPSPDPRSRVVTHHGFRTEASTAASAGFTERERLVKKVLGEFITGDITMPKPNIGGVLAGPRGHRTINIADLPISWDFFRQWWMNVAISRAGQTTLYFREFIIKLITDLLPRAIGSGCSWIADGEKTPQLLLNNYSVSGENIMGKAQYAIAFKDHAATGGKTPKPLIGRYATGDEIQEVFNLPLIKQQRAREAGPNTPITAISMRDTGAFVGTGDPKTDLEHNRVHINPVGETTAVVESVQFVKEDLPYIREANIDAGPLGIIREKYNCNLTAIGNTMYKPGGVFYINPKTLSRGKNSKAYGAEAQPDDKFAIPEKPDGTADDTPYARLLGLGGYYVITRITHVMDFSSGASGKWLTTFQAKWLAFANENDPCAMPDPEFGGRNLNNYDFECPEARAGFEDLDLL